ncbi:MAG: BatA domain-containing protein [Bacteroidales bacterium]
MKFVNPYFLFALFFIAIPVIIHLFNFRRFKRAYFSNVEFLKELKRETQKKSKVKHLLVLFSRILAISCLVFAFAQPFIPVTENKINAKGSVVSVYIDNSFSMEALSSKGSLFEEAKSKALEIADAYKPTDLFQILTNDFEGKHQAYVTKEEFIRMLQELDVSPSVRKFSEVITRQNDLFSTVNSHGKVAYIISDFPKITTDIMQIKADTNIEVNLIPLISNETNNIYIDSCWFVSPVMQVNQHVQLNVLLKNASDNDAEKIPVKLSINGKQKALASIDIPASSEAEVKLPYTIGTKGIQSGVVEIMDYPVIFDDKFYFSYNISEVKRVICISDKTESVYINSLFGKDSAFALVNMDVNKLDYSGLSDYKLIILNELKTLSSGLMQELEQYVQNGGSLLVFPGSDADLDTYKSFLSAVGSVYYTGKDTSNTKVSNINTDHEIYRDVFDKIPENIDLPVVKSHFNFSSKTFSTDEYIMKMQNGESFMISEKSGKGKVYLSSVPLNAGFSNFTKHAMFVPTLYNIALYSEPFNRLYYTIGKDEAVEVMKVNVSGDMAFRITDKSKNIEIIPEHRNIDLQTYVYPHDQIIKAGNYSLMRGEDTIAGISYNYNRSESDMKFYTVDELKNLIKEKDLKKFNVLNLKNRPISQVLEELNHGIRLWKLFIILTLLFLITEVALLRFMKS